MMGGMMGERSSIPVPKKAAGLTAREVKTIQRPGCYADGGGLYLDVADGGTKSWQFRFQLCGRRRFMGLGSETIHTLAEARQLAAAARKLAAEGIDPIEKRRADRTATRLSAATAITFRECAERYIASHRSGWKNPKHAEQWPSTLATYVYPVFGDLPVQAVDVGLVLKAIEPMWTIKPETASRVRGRIEAVLDWATARGYRAGENPGRWKGHLQNLLPKRSKVAPVEHHAALPYPDLADFMVKLRQQEGVAARAFEFAILTASRTGEVLGARWEEFSLAEQQWIVPGPRMKAGKEHRVALSDRAVAIIEEMAEIPMGDFVFPGNRANRPLSNMAFLMLLRRMGRGELTAHGFRSSFRDWAAERTAFPAEAAEMALAHAVSDKVEAAYRRGDLLEKRRQLMAAWARFADGEASPKIVPLRGGLNKGQSDARR
jgi:integrase